MKKLMLVLLAIAIPAVLLMGCSKKDDPLAAVMKNVKFEYSITNLNDLAPLGGSAPVLVATWTEIGGAPFLTITQGAGSVTYYYSKTVSLPQGTDLMIKLGGAAGNHASAKATVRILVDGVERAKVQDSPAVDVSSGAGIYGWEEATLTATCKAE